VPLCDHTDENHEIPYVTQIYGPSHWLHHYSLAPTFETYTPCISQFSKWIGNGILFLLVKGRAPNDLQ
jgi:hypothetical protein